MQTQVLRNGQRNAEDVDTTFLGDMVRVRLMRHAMRMYLANLRVGTHNTRRRGELHYRKAPLFKQKGTGRARVRHPQATQCRHGGKPVGPKPRDYSYQMPRRAKFEALRSALLAKFRDGEVGLIDKLDLNTPKTKKVVELLKAFGYDRTCLIVADHRDDNFLLAARNLRQVQVVDVADLNAHDVLRCRNVIMTDAALAQVREKTNDA